MHHSLTDKENTVGAPGKSQQACHSPKCQRGGSWCLSSFLTIGSINVLYLPAGTNGIWNKKLTETESLKSV